MEVVTPRSQGAVLALRSSCHADGSAVEYQAVAEVIALLRRQDLAKLHLHLLRLLALCKAQQIGDADAVGITDHGAGFIVEVSQDQVGGLSSHTGDGQQLFQLKGNWPSLMGARPIRFI